MDVKESDITEMIMWGGAIAICIAPYVAFFAEYPAMGGREKSCTRQLKKIVTEVTELPGSYNITTRSYINAATGKTHL